MKFIKLSVLCLALLVAMPASADIASFFNPFAWIRAAQRTYHWKMNPAKMVAAQEELERLQKIEVEAENIAKIYNVLNQPVEQLNSNLASDLQKDKDKLEKVFMEKQSKWGFSKHYMITSLDFFNKDILQPAIKESSKENYIAQPKPHESWHEKLKKDVQNLQKKERNKIAKDPETEFKDWQEEYATKNKVAQERNAWFEAYLRRTNFKTRQEKRGELEDLYGIDCEIDSLQSEYEKKIKPLYNKTPMSPSDHNEASEKKERLNRTFANKQKNWSISKLTYDLSDLVDFKNLVGQQIEETEKEIIKLGDSWYMQTRKKARNLAVEERMKTNQQREQEFKAWKEKKNKSNDELAKKFQDRNAWFEAWNANAKKNPNYK